MENTYWNHNGRYENIAEQLMEKVPNKGRSDNTNIEAWRVAVNTYYDLYNNGMCNWEQKKDDFETLLTVKLSKKGQTSLRQILQILPATGDTDDCPNCDGQGEAWYEEENDYIVDGELQYEIEEYSEHCWTCNGSGKADWTETWGYVSDYEHDKLAPLFEVLMDSIIEFIVLK